MPLFDWNKKTSLRASITTQLKGGMYGAMPISIYRKIKPSHSHFGLQIDDEFVIDDNDLVVLEGENLGVYPGQYGNKERLTYVRTYELKNDRNIVVFHIKIYFQ